MWPLCFSGITWEDIREQSGGAEVLGVLRGPLLPVLQRGFFSPCLLGAVLGKLFYPREGKREGLGQEREVGQDQTSSDLNLRGNVLVAAPLRDTTVITLPVSQADTSEWEILPLNAIQNDEPW